MKMVDLVGIRFGRVTVLKYIGKKYGIYSNWICKCDCGKQFKTISQSLTVGNTKSCGCLLKETQIQKNKKGEGGLRKIFRQYKSNAKFSKRSFKLSYKVFRQLITSNCHYCGVGPNRICKSGKTKEGHEYSKNLYNGLDRLDNSKGYVRNNIVTCCTLCNMARQNNFSYEEMVKYIGPVIKSIRRERSKQQNIKK